MRWEDKESLNSDTILFSLTKELKGYLMSRLVICTFELFLFSLKVVNG